MKPSAWADYLDARVRLVHEWAGEGLPFDAMVERLTPDRDQLMLLLLTSTEPLPGSSRDQATRLQLRLERLEREVHSVQEPPRVAVTPQVSEMRALLCYPDAALCGCQFWADPPARGSHHADCMYAPKAQG